MNREEGEKFISEELEEHGFTSVDAKKFQPSDEGESEKLIFNRIVSEEILKKAGLTAIEKEIVRLRLLRDDHTLDQTAQVLYDKKLLKNKKFDSPASSGWVREIESKARSKLNYYFKKRTKFR